MRSLIKESVSNSRWEKILLFKMQEINGKYKEVEEKNKK